MNIGGLFLAAVDAVAVHRSRTLLGVLSIIVGVASVTLVVAVGDVGRAAAAEIVERQWGRPATFVLTLDVPSWSPLGAAAIADRLAVAATNGGGVAARVVQFGGRVQSGAAGRPLQLVGADPSLAHIRRFRVVSGRWLRAGDGAVLGPVVTLNRAAAAELGLGTEVTFPVPILLDFGERVASVVVGIVDDGTPFSTAYLPVPSVQRWSVAPVRPLVFIWLPPERAGRVLDRLSDLASRFDVRSDAQRTDDPGAVDRFVGIIQLVLGAIAGLSLLTGGIGVVNLALAVVDQRTKEFAIRRAFGASQRDIFLIVLFESLITVGTGGLLGVAIALTGGVVVGLLFSLALGLDQLPALPVSAAALGLAVTVLLGLVVGVVPAQRATTRSVIRAIRD